MAIGSGDEQLSLVTTRGALFSLVPCCFHQELGGWACPCLWLWGEMGQEGQALRDGTGRGLWAVRMHPRSTDLSSWGIFTPTPSQVCGP